MVVRLQTIRKLWEVSGIWGCVEWEVMGSRGMPLPAQFKPKRTPAGWQIDIPATHSETGARRKLIFKSERLAKIEAAKRKRQMKQHGERAVHIDPDLAAQAIKAGELLEVRDEGLFQVVKEWVALREMVPADVTLGSIVKAWVEHRDEQGASATLREAFDWSIEKREKRKLSPLTIKDFKLVRDWLPGELLESLVCDIRKGDIEAALAGLGSVSRAGKSLKQLKTVFNEAIKKEWVETNPASKVDPTEACAEAEKGEKPVRIVTVEQLRNLFDACEDYREPGNYDRKNGLDCRGCEVPLAFLALAGIRPDELKRLEWADVSLEMRNIRIRAANSKTRTLRNVHIEDALAAWIETLPQGLRMAGKVVPTDWVNKRGLIFRKAGLPQEDKSDQDRLRHSYGSFHLGAFGDLEALQRNMGHEHASTYFAHYHNSIPKQAALAYWTTGPRGWKAQPIREAI